MYVSKAIFAGGCFWTLQTSFEKLPGVISTCVGYTGGQVPNPTYMEVANGKSGHAEAVEIIFEPKEITYEKLLDTFFISHDPTTLNRQGTDTGPQYRSVIFHADEKQKQSAIDKIAALEALHRYNAPIITQVIKAETFYPAEDYHQHYVFRRGETSCNLRTH